MAARPNPAEAVFLNALGAPIPARDPGEDI